VDSNHPRSRKHGSTHGSKHDIDELNCSSVSAHPKFNETTNRILGNGIPGHIKNLILQSQPLSQCLSRTSMFPKGKATYDIKYSLATTVVVKRGNQFLEYAGQVGCCAKRDTRTCRWLLCEKIYNMIRIRRTESSRPRAQETHRRLLRLDYGPWLVIAEKERARRKDEEVQSKHRQ
jgi:hypothetical protein